MRPSSVLSNERKRLGQRASGGNRVPMAGKNQKSSHPPKTTYAAAKIPPNDTASWSSANTGGTKDVKSK